MRVDVILPAGGRVPELTSETGTEVKALFPLAGRTLLRRTVSIVRATERTGRIVVIGPAEIAGECHAEVEAILPETDSGADNVLRGLAWLLKVQPEPSSRRLLVMATDLPFVTPAAIQHFLEACPPEAELCIPVIERKEFEARFPQRKTTYIPLRDGQWMIGCAMLLSSSVFTRNESLIRRVFAARRSPWAMARILGLRFILRFLLRRLTVPEIQEKCLALLGCTGQAVYGCPPELGFDIDYPQDYYYAAHHQPSAWSFAEEKYA